MNGNVFDRATDRVGAEVLPETAIFKSVEDRVDQRSIGQIIDVDGETVSSRQPSGVESGGVISDESEGARSSVPSGSQLSSTSKRGYAGHGAVKFGDNSITTNGVADVPIYCIPPSSAPSNFLSESQKTMLLTNERFRIDQGILYIRSQLRRINQPIEFKPSVLVEKTVFGTNPGASLENATCIMTPMWGTPEWKAAIEKSSMLSSMIGDVANAENVMSLMWGLLWSNNDRFWFDAASALSQNLALYDNSAVYVKLVYWALVLDYLEVCGQTPAFNEFGADDTITWIDVSPADATPTVFLDEVSKGSIMLVENHDWFDEGEALQAILWLAREGIRVRSADGSSTPDMCYVKWPSINVCVLACHARPKTYPVAAAMTSRRLLVFAQALAFRRNEDYDLCRAIYYALDICGVRYAADNGVLYRMDCFHSLAQPVIPGPFDHSVFCRLLCPTPSSDTHRQSEYQSWLVANAETRVRLAALYVAGMQIFSTTQLYAFSLTTADLVQWATGVSQSTSLRVMQDYGSTNYGIDGEEPLAYKGVKRAFIHYTGFSIEQDLYPRRRWHVSHGAIPDAAQHYAAFGWANDVTPRVGSVLAFDNFLLLRPQEWGVPGSHTNVDFKADLYRTCNIAKIGLYSHYGDSAYAKRAESHQPHLVVPYGVLMLNIFCQKFELPITTPRYFAAECHKFGPVWFSNDAADYESYAYNAELHIYEPCTVRTYDFPSNEIRAPAVTAPLMTSERADFFYVCSSKICLSNLGIKLDRDKCVTFAGMKGIGLPSLRNPPQPIMVSFGGRENV